MSTGSTRDYGEYRAPQRATPRPGSSYGEDWRLNTAFTQGEPARIVSASHAPQDSLGYRSDMRNPFRGRTEDVDEDTIELMLSPEQMRVLSDAATADAAGAATPASPPQASVRPTISTKGASPKATQPRHWPAGGVAAIVGVTVVLGTLVALGAIAQRTSERKHLAAAVPAPTPVAATPVAPQPPPAPGEPVRFKNPFDHSEVFEFPPGTSPAEARQAVAELLMERARGRHVQFVGRPHAGVRRASVRGGSAAVGADLAQNSLR